MNMRDSRWFRLGLASALGIGFGSGCAAQDAELVDFAHRTLAELQARSFATNREYCGTIGISSEGVLVASRPRRGKRDVCRPTNLHGKARALASFHTHAAFDAQADSELPSPQDLASDMAEGIDGFVATPGGRLWFNDGRSGETRLLCGPYCLPADPAFVDGTWGPLSWRYGLADLESRLLADPETEHTMASDR